MNEVRVQDRENAQVITSDSGGFLQKVTFYKWATWCLVALGGFAAVYGYTAFIGHQDPWNIDKNNLALYGSFLQGTVVSVWSLAAFIFVYVAFLGQQEALSHSQLEAAALERTAVQQRFESTFFNLLRLHHSIVDAMRIRAASGGPILEGRSCFAEMYRRLQSVGALSGPRPSGLRKTAEKAYLDFYTPYQPRLGHYFRNLFHLVRFVDESKIEKRWTYTRLYGHSCPRLNYYYCSITA